MRGGCILLQNDVEALTENAGDRKSLSRATGIMQENSMRHSDKNACMNEERQADLGRPQDLRV